MTFGMFFLKGGMGLNKKKITAILTIVYLLIFLTGCGFSHERKEVIQEELELNTNDIHSVNMTAVMFKMETPFSSFNNTNLTMQGDGYMHFAIKKNHPIQLHIKNTGIHTYQFQLMAKEDDLLITDVTLKPDDSYNQTFNQKQIDLPKGKYAIHFSQKSGKEIKTHIKISRLQHGNEQSK